MVKLQVLDVNGSWKTLSTTISNSQRIREGLMAIKKRFPKQSVRAIDSKDVLVDIL